MWPVVLTLSAVYGLVRLVAAQPEVRRTLRERKLAQLARKMSAGQLTRDESEDGAVLAREANETALERKFKDVARELKRRK